MSPLPPRVSDEQLAQYEQRIGNVRQRKALGLHTAEELLALDLIEARAALREATERIKQLEIGHDEWRTHAHRERERADKAEASDEAARTANEILVMDSADLMRRAASAETRRAAERERTAALERENEELRSANCGIATEEQNARIEVERLAARNAELEAALREIRGFDDTWSHRGHEPSEVGHECRMCWILKTVAGALSTVPSPTEKP